MTQLVMMMMIRMMMVEKRMSFDWLLWELMCLSLKEKNNCQCCVLSTHKCQVAFLHISLKKL